MRVDEGTIVDRTACLYVTAPDIFTLTMGRKDKKERRSEGISAVSRGGPKITIDKGNQNRDTIMDCNRPEEGEKLKVVMLSSLVRSIILLLIKGTTATREICSGKSDVKLEWATAELQCSRGPQ